MVSRSGQPLHNHECVPYSVSCCPKIFYQTHLFPMLTMENQIDEVYLKLKSKNGHEVPVLINAERGNIERNGINRCIVVRMQRRSNYEDQLLYDKEEAQENIADKQKLISMMSHDLRNPLNAILGAVELLSEELDRDAGDDIAEYLNLIETSSKNMARLADDILNFAKLETGYFTINPEVISLDEILKNAFMMAKREAKNKDIICTRSQDTGLNIYADPDRLLQVLMNLITNAIKFTEAKGNIELYTEKEAPNVKIDVKDSGVGIPAEKLEHIFKPFEQIKQENSAPKDSGFELGLTISKKLSLKMGGNLRVSSTPGEGTVFTLHIPLASGVSQNA